MPNDDSALGLARARLDDALRAVVGAASDERVRLAYEHGYRAGMEHGESAATKKAYRRGYTAGYKTAERGGPARPDGSKAGRPRLEVAQ